MNDGAAAAMDGCPAIYHFTPLDRLLPDGSMGGKLCHSSFSAALMNFRTAGEGSRA